MQFIAEDEPDLTLPEDSMHRARLEEIKLRSFTWTDHKENPPKEKEITSLEWWWEITSTKLGPEYIGRKVKAECNPKLSNRGDNRFRLWAEAILGREISVGMPIDTDDLVGLEAIIVIGHRQDKKDKNKTWEFVSDVAPVSDQGARMEPPF